jgi:foldase protein PrsA
MKVRRSFLALGAFFVIGAGIAGCGSSTSGDAVVNMAGNPISVKALNHWMYVAAKSQSSGSSSPIIVPNDPPDFTNCIALVRKEVASLAKQKTATLRNDCKQAFTQLSSQVMDYLIKSYWYQAEANKAGIKVTDASVQKTFDAAKNAQFKGNAAGFNNFLSQTGQTLPDLLFRFKINAVLQKLIAKHTKPVTAADIAAYYNNHQSSFGTQATRSLKLVLASSQKNAVAAKKALDSGQSWATVVKKYSTDPTTKSTGGVLNNVNKQQVESALATAAFSAPANKLVGPVKGQFGYYVFEVTKINNGTQQSLAEATAQIKQQLQSTAQTQAQTAVDNQAKKDWLSQTTCRAAYAMADCKGYKAPKTATTSTTGSSTG